MESLVKVERLSKLFSLGSGRKIAALRDVSFEIAKGETLGIVGESGCGKSTLARVMMGVYPPTEGQILFAGKPVSLRGFKARRAFAKKAQMIFQDPFACLNPRMTAQAIIAENLEIQNRLSREERQKKVYELLERVGLSRDHAGRFPHEFSGGQRQRIGIARALAIEPEFLICDESLSALDISVQSQIVNLLCGLKSELGLTYLFIAHDLNMVRYLSDRIAVMFQGSIVELAEAHTLCTAPRHPYTMALLDAVLLPDPLDRRLARAETLDGTASTDMNLAQGCPFARRCRMKQNVCLQVRPVLAPVDSDHFIACHMSQGR